MEKITALYIRVSTDRQSEEGYSIEAQQKKLEKWCELKDVKNYKLYIDGGWSGSNINRPQIQELIDDIKSNKVETVVVYKLDRLSRSQKDTVSMLEDIFIPNKVNFISLNENFDTSSPYGKAMIGILSVFAQLERENIRERTRMGMYERVQKGFWMGGGRVPFGYSYDQNKDILVPEPEQSNQVKKIFDLYLQGYSTTKLAEMFDVASDRHISEILKRETYLGKIKFNNEIFDGKHEAIIDEETFNKVQKMMKKRSTKKVQTTEHLFTSLIYCGKCGAKYRYQNWGKDTLGNHKYKIQCYSQQKSKKNLVKDKNCDNQKLWKDDFEKLVLEDLFLATDELVSKSGFLKKKTSALEVLQEKQEKINTEIKRLYNLYATNENENLLEVINEKQKSLNGLKKKIEKEKEFEKTSKEIEEKNMEFATIKNLRHRWTSMSLKEKQKVIRICIDKIVIDDDFIDIEYNF